MSEASMTATTTETGEAPASLRARILFRRTYARPLDEEGSRFETFGQVIDRVIGHQRWLWGRALGDSLIPSQAAELEELRGVMLARTASVSGRVLWLGGTETIRRRESSGFNCSYLDVRTVHDLVDAFWLLLQGCGVGFRPIDGALSGFTRRMAVEVVRSTRAEKGGPERNAESYDPATRTWTIAIGDSAEAWAKSVGKIAAGKFPADRLVLDLSAIRPAGSRLRGYGWICNGDELLSKALAEICGVLNRRVGRLLSKLDILDVVNWLGTVLANRRSAQIALMDHGDPEWREFATRKYRGFDAGPDWYRGQSNNSVVFAEKPTRRQLGEFFRLVVENGGAEPGFVNGAAAKARAPWWRGTNPCGEILLPNNGFCNLVEVNVGAFKGDDPGLHRAAYLIARANYRQTLVDLRDGILQATWHEQNEFLRLCGVGLTGIAQRPDLSAYDYRQIRNSAAAGAYAMADELGLERPKAVTTVKPSGTLSKAVFDSTEGAHKPKSRLIFNTVSFSRHDPLVPAMVDAGYAVRDHPFDPGAVLSVLPVSYEGVRLDEWEGLEVDREPASSQLERYRTLQRNYVDHNTSITVSYEPAEVPSVVSTVLSNWDDYVSCSFLFRDDPTKTAEDLGFAYLPQRAVTPDEYHAYTASLAPLSLDTVDDDGHHEIDAGSECAGGACPVK